MFNLTPWYHGQYRGYAALFGNLFNDITVVRRDKTGKVVQEILVPVDWAAKSKIIQRINQAKDLTQNVATTIPRMSFEITGLGRDPVRQLVPIVRNFKQKSAQKGTVNAQYVFVPYIINFDLNVYVKYEDDGFQIAEQIAPFFTPDWAIKVNMIKDMTYEDNVIIKLINQSFTDNYEGAIPERRMIIWTFSFQMDCRIYGPIKKTGLIKRVMIDLTVPEGKIDPSTIRYSNAIPLEVLTIQPGMTANNEPTTDPTQSISYFDINREDPWAYIEKWTDNTTGKVKYFGSRRPVETTGSTIITSSSSILDDKDYLPQLVQSINTSGNTVNINIQDGGYVILNLHNDVQTVNITNWPTNMVGKVTLEVRNQGDWNVLGWGSIKWNNGIVPDNTIGAGSKDIFILHSADEGVNIFGNIVGMNYS